MGRRAGDGIRRGEELVADQWVLYEFRAISPHSI